MHAFQFFKPQEGARVNKLEERHCSQVRKKKKQSVLEDFLWVDSLAVYRAQSKHGCQTGALLCSCQVNLQGTPTSLCPLWCRSHRGALSWGKIALQQLTCMNCCTSLSLSFLCKEIVFIVYVISLNCRRIRFVMTRGIKDTSETGLLCVSLFILFKPVGF